MKTVLLYAFLASIDGQIVQLDSGLAEPVCWERLDIMQQKFPDAKLFCLNQNLGNETELQELVGRLVRGRETFALSYSINDGAPLAERGLSKEQCLERAEGIRNSQVAKLSGATVTARCVAEN